MNLRQNEKTRHFVSVLLSIIEAKFGKICVWKADYPKTDEGDLNFLIDAGRELFSHRFANEHGKVEIPILMARNPQFEQWLKLTVP